MSDKLDGNKQQQGADTYAQDASADVSAKSSLDNPFKDKAAAAVSVVSVVASAPREQNRSTPRVTTKQPPLPTNQVYTPDSPAMRAAATFLGNHLVACSRGEARTILFGDFDVDGTTSAATLFLFARLLGVKDVSPFVSRRHDGYGLTRPAVERLVSESTVVPGKRTLAVLMDLGVSSAPEASSLLRSGIDVMVIDHHVPKPGALAEWAALKDQYGEDRVHVYDPLLFTSTEDRAYRVLSAAGLVYWACRLATKENIAGIADLIRATKRVEVHPGEKPEPKEAILGSMAKLAAIAQAADCMPFSLDGQLTMSWELAKRFELPEPLLAGVSVLYELNATASRIGWAQGPVINALGRLQDAYAAFELMVETNQERARRRLTDAQEVRKRVQLMTKNAQLTLENDIKTIRGVAVLVADPGSVSAGVVGITAARAADHYGAPAIYLVPDESPQYGSILKGSMRRGPTDFSCEEWVLSLKEAGIAATGGGHPAAAGVTIRASELSRLLGSAENSSFNLELPPHHEASVERALWYLSEISKVFPFGRGHESAILKVTGYLTGVRALTMPARPPEPGTTQALPGTPDHQGASKDVKKAPLAGQGGPAATDGPWSQARETWAYALTVVDPETGRAMEAKVLAREADPETLGMLERLTERPFKTPVELRLAVHDNLRHKKTKYPRAEYRVVLVPNTAAVAVASPVVSEPDGVNVGNGDNGVSEVRPTIPGMRLLHEAEWKAWVATWSAQTLMASDQSHPQSQSPMLGSTKAGRESLATYGGPGVALPAAPSEASLAPPESPAPQLSSLPDSSSTDNVTAVQPGAGSSQFGLSPTVDDILGTPGVEQIVMQVDWNESLHRRVFLLRKPPKSTVESLLGEKEAERLEKSYGGRWDDSRRCYLISGGVIETLVNSKEPTWRFELTAAAQSHWEDLQAEYREVERRKADTTPFEIPGLITDGKYKPLGFQYADVRLYLERRVPISNNVMGTGKTYESVMWAAMLHAGLGVDPKTHQVYKTNTGSAGLPVLFCTLKSVLGQNVAEVGKMVSLGSRMITTQDAKDFLATHGIRTRDEAAEEDGTTPEGSEGQGEEASQKASRKASGNAPKKTPEKTPKKAAKGSPEAKLRPLQSVPAHVVDDFRAKFLDSTPLLWTTYDCLARHPWIVSSVRWAGMVVDEAQELKNPASHKTRAILGPEIDGSPLRHGDYTAPLLFMTGTIVKNRPADFYCLVRMTGADGGIYTEGSVPETTSRFEQRFDGRGWARLQMWDKKLKRKITRTIKVKSEPENGEELKQMMRHFMVRRLQTELTDMPPLSTLDPRVQSCGLYFDVLSMLQGGALPERSRELLTRHGLLSGVGELQSERVQKDSDEDDHYAEEVKTVDPTSLAGKLAMVSSLDKAASCLTILERLGWWKKGMQDADMEPLVIMAFHKSAAREVSRVLDTVGITNHLMLQEDSAKKRAAKIESFDRSERKVFVCTYGTGGVGLNLTRAAKMLCIGLPWTESALDQARSRVFRIGQLHPTTVAIAILAASIDESTYVLLLNKGKASFKTVEADLVRKKGTLPMWATGGVLYHAAETKRQDGKTEQPARRSGKRRDATKRAQQNHIDTAVQAGPKAGFRRPGM